MLKGRGCPGDLGAEIRAVDAAREEWEGSGAVGTRPGLARGKERSVEEANEGARE